jgi:formylglycine-generating enzyme
MKSKNALCGLAMAVVLQLGVLAVVHPALAQSALGIVPTNNQVILFWPITTNGTNGVLQSATSLVSANWLSATDAFPVNYGAQIAVSVTNVSSARFFRLSLVPPAADGMALIPAGSFTIGNPIGDSDSTDANPTNVYVSAFYMDTNLVSLSQWLTVYSYATNHGYSFVNAGTDKAMNYPVETVDWFDCVKWSNARSAQAGLTSVYYTDAGFMQVYTNGETTNLFANWTANGYRLPTEAEWEKAARGGLSGQRFPWGDTISESQANYNAYPNPPNSGGFTYDLGPYTGNNTNFDTGSYHTSPVGYFAPNGYGLNDMAGNVYEWCWDWYAAPPYPTGSPYLGGTDPRGPVGPLSSRVLRGGIWSNYAYAALCADRYCVPFPSYSVSGFGFRCVRGLPNMPTAPVLTGNRDLDMYNAAVADGTANGGVPAVMVTEHGGPFRVTALGRYSDDVANTYTGWAVFTQIVGTESCSSTTLPSGTWVIQFGTPLSCGSGSSYRY